MSFKVLAMQASICIRKQKGNSHARGTLYVLTDDLPKCSGDEGSHGWGRGRERGGTLHSMSVSM